MGIFFIDTDTGQVALESQLRDAGIFAPSAKAPPRPWLRIQGTRDATTLWYAVMRRQFREGIFIGAICIRHSDHHTLLERRGYVEVPVAEVGRGIGQAREAAPRPGGLALTPEEAARAR